MLHKEWAFSILGLPYLCSFSPIKKLPWVVQNGLGVDASLVSEGTVTSDVVVEGHSNLDSISNNVLNITNSLEVVLVHDVALVSSVHASQQTTKRGDTITFTNTQDRGINVSSTCFKSYNTNMSSVFDPDYLNLHLVPRHFPDVQNCSISSCA